MRSIEHTFAAGRSMEMSAAAVVRPEVRRPGRLRLTRRGRVVVVLVALVLLVLGFSVGRVSSQAAGNARGHAVHTVTVRAGETLWQIARRVSPQSDPRVVVWQLEQVNHLSDGRVLAGQQLVLPR
jgi:hypothetical protein